MENTFPKIVDYAYEVIRMHNRIEELESQVAHLEYFKTEYFKVVEASSLHSQKLLGIAIAGTIGDHETAQKIADL